MSEIVERLGNLYDTEEHPAMRELYADCKYEIERLREELEFAEGKYLACYNAKCEVDRENERLRAGADPSQRIWDDGYAVGKAAAAADIERLRAALQLSQSQNYCTLCGCDLDRALEGK